MFSRVNIIARNERHQRIFQEGAALERLLTASTGWIKRFICLDWSFKRPSSFLEGVNSVTAIEIPIILDPYKSIFKKVCFATFVFFLLSLSPWGMSEEGYNTREFTNDQSQTYSVSQYLGQSFIVDDEGYIVKAVPSDTNLSQYLDRRDIITHEVQPGEYLALIAQKYGLQVRTLMWSNTISNDDILHPGDKLIIPPVDGVLVTVKKGDTVEKYTALYHVDTSAIVSANYLDKDLLIAGDTIVIPGAKPLPPAKPRYAEVQRSSTSSRTASRQYTQPSRKEIAQVDAVGDAVTSLLLPTSGTVTQGFRSGHWGIDIANPSKPAVVAAASGVVSEVNVGNWGGGYGNFIKIKHAGGIETLYAHLDNVYVSAGEEVAEGEAIAQMGNTGRVYGKTGIHVHFEVVKDGRKINPWNMIQ